MDEHKPREQNLDSPVAKTIAGSLKEPHEEFYLRNRGILLSAKSLAFEGQDRDEALRHMVPVFMDILHLWDTIECEFGSLNKAYSKKRFVTKTQHPVSLFSNREIPYYVPQALLFPMVAAFRALLRIDETTKDYMWATPPFEAWENNKMAFAKDILHMPKTFKDVPAQVGKNGAFGAVIPYDCGL